MKNLCVKGVKGVSIEITVLFYAIGCGMLNGAQIETNLIIWKLCRFELNYTEEICKNLTTPEHNLQNIEVQKRHITVWHFRRYQN